VLVAIRFVFLALIGKVHVAGRFQKLAGKEDAFFALENYSRSAQILLVETIAVV